MCDRDLVPRARAPWESRRRGGRTPRRCGTQRPPARARASPSRTSARAIPEHRRDSAGVVERSVETSRRGGRRRRWAAPGPRPGRMPMTFAARGGALDVHVQPRRRAPRVGPHPLSATSSRRSASLRTVTEWRGLDRATPPPAGPERNRSPWYTGAAPSRLPAMIAEAPRRPSSSPRWLGKIRTLALRQSTSAILPATSTGAAPMSGSPPPGSSWACAAPPRSLPAAWRAAPDPGDGALGGGLAAWHDQAPPVRDRAQGRGAGAGCAQRVGAHCGHASGWTWTSSAPPRAATSSASFPAAGRGRPS